MTAPASEPAVEALLRRMESPTTQESALGIATELGHLLAERQLTSAEARTARLSFVRWERRATDQAVSAQLQAYVKLLAAYEASRQSNEEEADTLRGLDAEAQRILHELSARPATSAQLAGGKDNGKLTRRLAALEAKGLIETTVGPDRRARPRVLTALGQVVAARLNASAPSPASSASLRDIVSSCVESTLRALKSVRMSSTSTPMHRAEVRATLSLDLLPHGFLEAFEYFAESFGLIDIDDEGRFWDTAHNQHAERWQELFDKLANDPELCEELFTLPMDQTAVLLTVSERVERWRSTLSELKQRVYVVTADAWRHMAQDHAPRKEQLIIDDSTLARNFSQRETRPAKTIEKTDRRAFALQTVPPPVAMPV